MCAAVSASTHSERSKLVRDLGRRGIDSAAVLQALEGIPREFFVMPAERALAYRDQALPISCGQTISQPFVVAYMTQQLAVEPHHSVLEVGTGSGYQAAVLSRLARRVISIERHGALATAARVRLKRLGCDNVEVLVGDGMQGAEAGAPFDRIIVTAAAERVPETLPRQLADDGVMILPVGPQDGPQMLIKIVKSAHRLTRMDLIEVWFVPLLAGEAQEF